MPTYLHRGERIFKENYCSWKDKRLRRKRSHARLKNFTSCTDVRAWGLSDTERSDLLKEEINKAETLYGNYIPSYELCQIIFERASALGLPATKIDALYGLIKEREVIEAGFRDTLTCDDARLHHRVFQAECICNIPSHREEIDNLRLLVKELTDQKLFYDEQREELKSTSQKCFTIENRLEELMIEKDCLLKRWNGIMKSLRVV